MKPVEFQALKVVELKKNIQILKYFLKFTTHQKNLKDCIRLRLSICTKWPVKKNSYQVAFLLEHLDEVQEELEPLRVVVAGHREAQRVVHPYKAHDMAQDDDRVDNQDILGEVEVLPGDRRGILEVGNLEDVEVLEVDNRAELDILEGEAAMVEHTPEVDVAQDRTLEDVEVGYPLMEVLH